MLHVRCGDDIIGTLRAAGLPGEFLVWADPVCQGPIPATVRGDAWYALRADFIARAYGADPAEAAGRLRAADAALAARDRHEEIVLWFEHDLFDQAILVQLLARLAEQRAHQLSLVTLDSHPSTSRFIGLGQLDSADLAELFARRFVVTAEMLAAGSAAWAALGAPTPEPAAELARAPGGALPFLPAALTRHLRELPSVEQGLGRTEQLVLEAAAAGAGSAGEVFQAVQEREPAPWLGDSMLYAVVASLASARAPLVRVGGRWPADAGAYARATVALTDAGRAVLAGRVDAVALNGMARWVGGVELRGTRAAWRWDESSRRPVRG